MFGRSWIIGRKRELSVSEIGSLGGVAVLSAVRRQPRTWLLFLALVLALSMGVSGAFHPGAAHAASTDTNTLYNGAGSVGSIYVLMKGPNGYTEYRYVDPGHTVGGGAAFAHAGPTQFYLSAGYCTNDYVNGVHQTQGRAGPGWFTLGGGGNNWQVYERFC
jgi:hypothetical protein